MPTTNTSGRRKTAVARIYLSDGNGAITVNGKDYKEYFPTLPLQYIVTQSVEVSGSAGKYDVLVNVAGGGVKGQAEAVRGMLPKSRLGKALFGNLHVYAGTQHPHAAQNPKTI